MALDRDTLDRLFRYSYSLTGDEDAAYDLLQKSVERYLKASRKREVESATAYVRQIIRNTFIDEHRRQQRFPEMSLEEAHDEGILEMGTRSLENQMVAAQDVGSLWKTFLDPAEREVLYLWAVEGFSTSEIAAQSGVSRNTILSRIHRLRKRLRAWYEGGDASEEASS